MTMPGLPKMSLRLHPHLDFCISVVGSSELSLFDNVISYVLAF